MKWLTLVIFLFSCSHSFGLSCVRSEYGKPLNISLEDFDFDQFQTNIQNLSSTQNINEDKCHILLNINYKEQWLLVRLTEHIEYKWLEDEAIEFSTDILGTDIQNIHVEHSLQYACSFDKCETNFVLNYISWLVNASYPQLPSQLAPIIFRNGEGSGKCFDEDSILNKCTTGQCKIGAFPISSKETFITQSCAEADSLADYQFQRVNYFTSFNSKLKKKDWIFKLHCHYHACNDNSNLDELKRIYNEVYNINSIMAIFGYEDINDEQIYNITTNSIELSTVEQTTSSLELSSTITTSIKSILTTSPIASTAMPTTIVTSTTTIQTSIGYHLQHSNFIIYITLMIFLFCSIYSI